MELKARKNVKSAAAPMTLEGRVSDAFHQANTRDGREGAVGGAVGAGGAAEAAGVLTAIDEDGEGAEEAQCPDNFDYESEGEGGGED